MTLLEGDLDAHAAILIGCRIGSYIATLKKWERAYLGLPKPTLHPTLIGCQVGNFIGLPQKELVPLSSLKGVPGSVWSDGKLARPSEKERKGIRYLEKFFV